MTAPAKTTDIYKKLRLLTNQIRYGKFISIDPSIGSSSSMPAYSIYDRGELVHSAKLKIDHTKSTYEKAQEISRQLTAVYKMYKPQVLVYEEIPDQGYAPSKGINHRSPHATGFNQTAHATLLKALGVILGCYPGPEHAVGLRPMVWKKRSRQTYRKGDINDAIEIGYVCIQMAREIEELENGKIK